MDEKQVKAILGDVITDDGGLYSLGWYLQWGVGEDSAVLDGQFDLEELEAIAWWMKNKG